MNTFKVKILLFISIFVLSFPSAAQQKGEIGITFSTLTSSSVLHPQMDGAPTLNIPRSRSIGINYLKPLNAWAELEAGVEYALFNVQSISAVNPPLARDTTNSTLSLINIPVGVRANFMKYFFINGGLLLDLDMNSGGFVDSQTGIGAFLGAGATYNFKFGGSVFINPYGKIHSLLPFSFEGSHYRILESGIRFGVMWKL